MKKIGLWMAALTAVTVGGVYATFNYSDNFQFSKTGEAAIGIEAAAPAGAVGSYEVDTSAFKITIDSAESANRMNEYTDVHQAVLVMSGSITITFKPAPNAEHHVSENGIETTFAFAPVGDINNWTYDSDGDGTAETQIFTDYEAYQTTIYPKNSEATSVEKWSVADNGAITYTISFDDIPNVLTLNETIILDTSAEHARFKQAVLGKNLMITVTAVAPASNA